jgi:uncharacterized membrane protein
MISRWQWLLKHFFERLWVIALLYALLAVTTIGLSSLLGPLLPDGLGVKLGAGALETVLTILASSLLSVVTFSLGIMVSAFTGAAAAVTPRATSLLKADRTTQRVLSVFLGSFLFSLIGIITLTAGLYDDEERLILFAVTLLVVLLVVIAIFRWIAHLSVFGLMSDSISKVEAAVREALKARMEAPFLGGHGHDGPPPSGAAAVLSPDIGYVCHIDMEALQTTAKANGLRLYVAALPGSFVHPGAPLIWVDGKAGDCAEALAAAFTIESARDFDQDPRFGLSVLTEIAERALSPAVNDPGTAIDVLGRAVRLLALWQEPREAVLQFPLVWVPPLRLADMMGDVFPAIARDGAGVYSIQMRLQKSLLALARISAPVFAAEARHHSEQALARAAPHMLPQEAESLHDVASQIASLPAGPLRQPM